MTSTLDPIRAGLVGLRMWIDSADGSYAGDKLASALAGLGNWTIEIVRYSAVADGFEVIPRYWVRLLRP